MPFSPRKGRKGKPAQPKAVQWAHLSAEEASGRKVGLSARPQATSINVKNLKLTTEQRKDINHLYETEEQVDNYTYEYGSLDDQILAGAMLAAVRLDLDARNSVVKYWVRRWSQKSGKGDSQSERVLYQPSRRHKNKRPKPDIIPPSPERTQKRKDSNGIR